MHAHVEQGSASAKAKCEYARHRPEDTVLYNIIEQHAPSFFQALGDQGASLPGFVRDEFDAYMRCGRLAHFNTAEVVNIEGAGHWVHHDRLDEFLRLLRAFLSDAS